MIDILALQLAWFACVPVYCAARQQKIRDLPLAKSVAWPLFLVGSVLATILLMQSYHWLTAVVLVLLVVMLGWILLAIVTPYFVHAWRVLPAISLLVLIVSLIGYGDVG
ncbi:hypothetical protein Q7C_1805 [Methylophaga frappieri]|uniref:DUF3325 domain-containing protein n=1 Tax=Methylophaga frappieri (strain ATCC BAA-2434 / DSM 25690 / JAM7) TaxID=754477 RepID=I1YJ53_METFJ|nr:hypothetical protein [Methylophaga frappieri]AFJ02946.1 hypothetical protein Q7C_1805 [Methylophaga frappieri]